MWDTYMYACACMSRFTSLYIQRLSVIRLDDHRRKYLSQTLCFQLVSRALGLSITCLYGYPIVL